MLSSGPPFIQAEILDETDRYVDNLRTQRVDAARLYMAL